ncbi:MAG: hypothetical protein ACRDZ3_03360 [Acidimicrobiia bacterium]
MENVILLTLAEPARALEAMEALRRLSDEGAVTLRGAAIIERYPDGRWRFPEETEELSYQGTITGGAIGGLIGLLAGPAGLLLGATAGLVVGSAAEMNDVEDVETILHAFPRKVPPGATALVADVHEVAPAVVDTVLGTFGAGIERMSRAQAEADIAAAEKAAAADPPMHDSRTDDRGTVTGTGQGSAR